MGMGRGDDGRHDNDLLVAQGKRLGAHVGAGSLGTDRRSMAIHAWGMEEGEQCLLILETSTASASMPAM